MDLSDGHIIVCGMGQCGFRVVRLLRRLGRPVTAISLATRDDWIRQAEADGATVKVGDARDTRLLGEAGLARSGALIAVTDQDAVNVEIALHAKQTRGDLPVVIRIFDQALARQLESALQLNRALAVSALAAPRFAGAILGDELLGAFEHEGTLFWIGRQPARTDSAVTERAVLDWGLDERVVPLLSLRGEHAEPAHPSQDPRAGDQLVLVGPAAVWRDLQEGSWGSGPHQETERPRRGLAGATNALRVMWQLGKGTSRSIRIAFLGLNALILLSVFVFQIAMDLSFVDALYFIVATVTTTGYGDITPTRSSDFLKLYAALVMILGSATLATLYSLITDLIVTARFREVLGRQRVPPAGHVVVAGLGNLGYRVVGQLQAAGVPVVVIERNASGELVGAVDSSVEVIFGDARSPDVLDRAAISQARAVAAVTGDDAVNLGVSLAAREMNGGLRTITRLFDADLARQTQAALRIDAVLSASAIAVPTFAASALYPNLLHAVVVGDRMLVLYRQVVNEEWSGLTPGELAARHGVVPMSWSASSQALLVSPPTVPLNLGEDLVVAQSLPLAP